MSRAIQCLSSTPLMANTLPVHAVRALRKTSHDDGVTHAGRQETSRDVAADRRWLSAGE
jgi:hypothetical protein